MIKKLSFMAVLALPSLAFAQSAAPVRPNHTLPQYGALTAANSNTGAPRAMLRMATPSAEGTYAPLWPPGGLRKDTHIPSLYADGSSGTLDQIGRMADGSVQQTDVGATVAPLDDNKMMPVPVSGDTSSAPVTAKGTTIARNMAARAADANNLSNYVTTYDGSDTFKSQVTALYNALGMNGIIQIPCNAPWPMYDTKTGIAWGPSGKGALFVDTCGNNWRGAPGWTTPAYDRGFGDNNPTLVNYNGEILLNRQNTSSSNGNGLLGVHVSDYSVSAAKYGGGIDADAPMVRFVYDLHQYGLDGVTPVRGSPLRSGLLLIIIRDKTGRYRRRLSNRPATIWWQEAHAGRGHLRPMTSQAIPVRHGRNSMKTIRKAMVRKTRNLPIILKNPIVSWSITPLSRSRPLHGPQTPVIIRKTPMGRPRFLLLIALAQSAS